MDVEHGIGRSTSGAQPSCITVISFEPAKGYAIFYQMEPYGAAADGTEMDSCWIDDR